MRVPREVKDNLVSQLDDYGSQLANMNIRQILNSHFEPVNDSIEEGLNMMDPITKRLVDWWSDTMRDWRKKYGSIEGYAQFHQYWTTGSHFRHDTGLANASAYDAFNSSEFQDTRDYYGNGASGWDW
jgi:hypothetical protein